VRLAWDIELVEKLVFKIPDIGHLDWIEEVLKEMLPFFELRIAK